MNPGWTYLTLERTQMNLWSRKRRLKFRKRWRKQHGGQNFRWYAATWTYVPLPLDYQQKLYENMIFFKREPTT